MIQLAVVFHLYKLETQTPSLPKWSDWKYIGAEQFISRNVEAAARMAFASSDADRIYLEDDSAEEPVGFYREQFQ